jgi:hypothetical protein
MKRKKRERRQRERPALEWRESTTVKKQDELCTHDAVVATLRWAGMLSNFATGTAQAGQWTFDRPRIFARDVEVRRVGANGETPYAVYYPNWSPGGRLEFAHGRTIHWGPTNFWQTRWVFESESDITLMQFEDTSRLFRESAAVTFARRGLPDEERALLLLLGRYLMVLQSRDTAAITAATTAAYT